MRAAWVTDIHLNFLRPAERVVFFEGLRAQRPDVVLITGDIAEAPSLRFHLEEMWDSLDRPLYFVLGNHDFYFGSIDGVRKNVQEWCEDHSGLRYVSGSGVIPLSSETALVGQDGWGDGRWGNYAQSPVRLNDQALIHDFQDLDRQAVLTKLNTLGDEEGHQMCGVLREALESYKKVLCLTHVPPFKEACWYQGKMGNDDWLPYFTCKAVGEVLVDLAQEFPSSDITVLCGHTHHGGTVEVASNLRVITGSAEYGAPCISKVFEIP